MSSENSHTTLFAYDTSLSITALNNYDLEFNLFLKLTAQIPQPSRVGTANVLIQLRGCQ